jgi:Acetyltransferase (GNAT) domain
MDYHGDRFPDASLVALDDQGQALALLPATRQDDEVVSHAGLTYGGFLTDERMTLESMLALFDASLDHLRRAGVTTLVYKTAPRIYHRSPAEEDLYALFLHGAELYRRDVLSVLDYAAGRDWERRWRWRMRKAGKAMRAGLEIRESDEYDRFWQLLTANLERRHGLRPVHTLEEIELLAGRFPGRIQLFGAYRGEEMEAGAVTYLSDTVCHAQYSASSEEGRVVRALDLVFAHLIDAFRDRVRYFDFGISTESDGRVLNAGLLEYKERFGARAVVHDFYRLSLV